MINMQQRILPLFNQEKIDRARQFVQLPKKALLGMALRELVEHQKVTLQLMEQVNEFAKQYNEERKQDVGSVVSECLITLRSKEATDLADALEGAFRAWRNQQGQVTTTTSESTPSS